MYKEFTIFGPAHLLAILTTIFLAIGLTLFLRRNNNPIKEKYIRLTTASLLVLVVCLDPILTILRYGNNEKGWGLVLDSALPLYLCDIVSISLAIALLLKNQRLAEIGYLWGLAGTVQGLITPTLWFGPSTVEFYVFFLQHGGVPVAAVMLVWGLKIVPEKGAFVRALYWSWSYMAVVMLINWLINKNYGFLNGVPTVPTLFDYMGPYPYYLITLQGIAFLFYAILLLIAPKARKTNLNSTGA